MFGNPFFGGSMTSNLILAFDVCVESTRVRVDPIFWVVGMRVGVVGSRICGVPITIVKIYTKWCVFMQSFHFKKNIHNYISKLRKYYCYISIYKFYREKLCYYSIFYGLIMWAILLFFSFYQSKKKNLLIQKITTSFALSNKILSQSCAKTRQLSTKNPLTRCQPKAIQWEKLRPQGPILATWLEVEFWFFAKTQKWFFLAINWFGMLVISQKKNYEITLHMWKMKGWKCVIFQLARDTLVISLWFDIINKY